MQWLQRWSQQLGSLRMVLHQTQQLQQLPCNTLSKLMVRGGELQPPLLFPPLVSTLTKLVLENTSLLISAQQQSLVLRQELSRLTNLRHLALRIRGWQQAAADEGTWQFLMPLQDLTELRLGADCGAGMMPGLAMNISRFISLQVLEIEDTVYRSAPQVDPLCSLQHLQSLRKLRLSGNGCRITQNSSTSLGSLTGLSCLQLQLCYFSVAAVSAITGLQSLSVQHPYYPVTAAKLYAWLPGLQQLTSLCLGGQRVSPADLPAGPDRNAACRAPTGSRYLQKLDLQNVYMPEDTWQHVFPADKEMVQLTYLKLPRGLESIPGGTLGTATVQGIVRCCPCLQVGCCCGCHGGGVADCLQNTACLHPDTAASHLMLAQLYTGSSKAASPCFSHACSVLFAALPRGVCWGSLYRLCCVLALLALLALTAVRQC